MWWFWSERKRISLNSTERAKKSCGKQSSGRWMSASKLRTVWLVGWSMLQLLNWGPCGCWAGACCSYWIEPDNVIASWWGAILENLVVAMLPQGFQNHSSAILKQFNRVHTTSTSQEPFLILFFILGLPKFWFSSRFSYPKCWANTFLI